MKKGIDNHIHIIPEEVEIVRITYKRYLEGQSPNSIAAIPTKMGERTIRGNTRWNGSSIQVILTNEMYIGDNIAQKTFTVDYLLKDRRKNKGKLSKYYVQNLHEPIISKELHYGSAENEKKDMPEEKSWHEVWKNWQEDILKNFYQILICGERVREYRGKLRKKSGKEKAVWRCENRLRNGIYCCRYSKTLEKELLHGIIFKGINHMLDQIQIGESEAEEIFEIQTEVIPKQAQKENPNLSAWESIYGNIADNLEVYEKMDIPIKEQLVQGKIRLK